MLVREATGTPARVFARFGMYTVFLGWPPTDFIPTERGVEKHVELDNLSAAEVETKVGQLLSS